MLFVLGWALALVGDNASNGGCNAGLARYAASFFADIDDFFLTLFHAGLKPGL
jgi:hypothetical protein